jgi:hypothetical protein
MTAPRSTGLPPDLDAALRDELRAGEELWYSGMPAPRHFARTMWPIALFGLFFGGFAAFWIASAAAGVWFGTQSGGDAGTGEGAGDGSGGGSPGAIGGLFLLFPLFGLPFLAVGLAMILSPVWAARRARRTVCCVTSTRALQLTVGRTLRVKSWSAGDIAEVTKTVYADGSGTILFVRSLGMNSRRRPTSTPEGFYGVPDPRACEEALLLLKATSRSASGPRTAP